MKEKAQAKKQEGFLLDLQPTTYIPVMEDCDNRDIRRATGYDPAVLLRNLERKGLVEADRSRPRHFLYRIAGAARREGAEDMAGAAPNATAEAAVARLPKAPMLAPRDIADALALATTASVIDAIESGALAAVRINRRYVVARAEACRWIRSLGGFQ